MNQFESKELKMLPSQLQNIIKSDRLTRESSTKYIRLFEGVERLAIENNIKASDYTSGVVYGDQNILSGVAPRLFEIDCSKTAGRVYYIGPRECKDLKERIPEAYLTRVIKKAVAEAKKTGRSLLAVYKDGDNDKATIKSYDLFHHKLVWNEYDEIAEAYLFVNVYSLKAHNEYYVLEHRYFKNGKPIQCFEVCNLSWKTDSDKTSYKQKYDKDNIPKEVVERFPDIQFYKEQEMPFDDLGVYNIDNKAINTKWSSLRIPEASFVNCLDKISQIECSNTYKELDKVLGRGRVMLPRMKNTSNQFIQTIGGAGNNTIRVQESFIDTTFMQPYDSMTMNDSSPQPVQFQLRVEEWNSALREDISELCAIYGISVLDFDPRLLQQGQRTDDEINALTDITIQTVTDFRELNEHELNKMLSCFCKAWGFDMPVTIKWSMASVLNPTKNAQLVQGLLSAGLISRREALKRLNPEYTDDELEEELARINDERASESISDAFNNL